MKKPPHPPKPAPDLATQAHEGTPHYGNYGHPAASEAANDTPAPALTAENGTEAELYAEWAQNDPRYAGGDKFDLKTEQTSL